MTHGIKSKDIRKYKNNFDIVFLEDWPPDFNVIENIWRLPKQWLKSQEAILKVKDLKIALQGEWGRITQEEIKSTIVSMPTILYYRFRSLFSINIVTCILSQQKYVIYEMQCLNGRIRYDQ